MINFSGTENDVRIIAQDEIKDKLLEHEKMNEAQIDKSINKALNPIYTKLNLLNENLAVFKSGIDQSIKTNHKWTMGLIGISAVIAALFVGFKG